MRLISFQLFLVVTVCPLLITSCSGEKPPEPGSEISMDKYGIHIVLNDPWTAECEGSDWSTWTRQQKGRVDEHWLFPPITATKNEAGGMYDRTKHWRFKGVVGLFDPGMNSEMPGYPVPEGLWALNPQMLEMQSQDQMTLPWASAESIQATVRIYENTHGEGAAATLWHTMTVTFNVGGNAYEFVMSIPADMDKRELVDDFWASIQTLEIASI